MWTSPKSEWIPSSSFTHLALQVKLERETGRGADLTNLGPPKPIHMNHAAIAVADNDRNLPTVKGRKSQSYALWNFEGSGGRYYAAFPPFHVSVSGQ